MIDKLIIELLTHFERIVKVCVLDFRIEDREDNYQIIREYEKWSSGKELSKKNNDFVVDSEDFIRFVREYFITKRR